MNITSEKLILDAIASELMGFTGVEQVIREDQEVPESELKDPRISLKFIVSYADTRMHPDIEQRATEDAVHYDIDFDYQKTLSIQVIGKDKEDCVGISAAARIWMITKQLATYFLEQHRVVVLQVLNSQDRTTFLETGYQAREGFDVRLGFSDVVTIDEDTIENVEFDAEVS